MRTVTEEENINSERCCGQRGNFQCLQLCLKPMALPGSKLSESPLISVGSAVSH